MKREKETSRCAWDRTEVMRSEMGFVAECGMSKTCYSLQEVERRIESAELEGW